MFRSKTRARTEREGEIRLKGIFARLERLESAPAPELPPTTTNPATIEHLETLQAGADSARLDLVELERRVKEYAIALSEGIERTDRAERRIKATVARARKELKDRGYEDPGLEAEAHELRIVDGGGSKDGGVPAVPAEVADPTDAPSSVAGVSAAALQRVRGF